MFGALEREIISRVSDIREYATLITNTAPSPPITTPSYLNLAKGFLDVHLYGMIEYTVNQTVAIAISFINSDRIKLSAIKPQIMSLVLDAELSSLFGATSRKWDKRRSIFQALELDNDIFIRNDIMPTDGKNFTSRQLESIRETFCIRDNLFHDNRFRGLLQSIVGNRINVAHGNNSGAETGANLSLTDMRPRIDDTFAFCVHFVSTFETYLLSKHYKV